MAADSCAPVPCSEEDCLNLDAMDASVEIYSRLSTPTSPPYCPGSWEGLLTDVDDGDSSNSPVENGLIMHYLSEDGNVSDHDHNTMNESITGALSSLFICYQCSLSYHQTTLVSKPIHSYLLIPRPYLVSDFFLIQIIMG